MALWLSLVLATLSYAAPHRAQGGEFRTDTLAAHRNPIRPLRPHLHVGHLHRRNRHLLVVINES
jgi:hypothetical protein